MAKVTVQDVTKVYVDEKIHEQVLAVNRASFTCEDGEFLVLLGPSGCGKTSILRMIAGLEDISMRQIIIGETGILIFYCIYCIYSYLEFFQGPLVLCPHEFFQY